MTTKAEADILAAVDRDWHTAKTIHAKMGLMWSYATVKHILRESARTGLIERKTEPIKGGVIGMYRQHVAPLEAPNGGMTGYQKSRADEADRAGYRGPAMGKRVAAYRDIVAEFLGDPRPGQSALDRRGSAPEVVETHGPAPKKWTF